VDKPRLRKLQTFEAILLFLQLKIIIWTASLTFTAEVAALEAGINRIKEKDRLSKKSIDATKGKKQKREKMIKDTTIICDAGVAYADSINDDELRGKFNFSPSDLDLGNDEIVIARCKEIGKNAIPVTTGLIAWGMPTGHLAIQVASVDTYELASPKGKAIVTTGKSTNKEMVAEFKLMDTHLKNRMDKLVNGYEKAFPDFVTEYYDKRYIGGRKKKVVPPIVPPVPPVVPPVDPAPPMA